MESSNQSVTNSRTAVRSKMFLAATLGVGESAKQCRIRNMSDFGALIECGSIMTVGSTVIIARGALRAAGEVKWSSDGLLGIKFSGQIEIQEWLGEPFSTVSRPTLRNPVTPKVPESSAALIHEKVVIDDNTINWRLAEELLYVSRIVEGIGELLVKDPLLRVRHPMSLQHLDMGQQMLSELAQIVKAEGKLGVISQVATGPMRGRLLRTTLI